MSGAIERVLADLFGDGHGVVRDGGTLTGVARFDGRTVTVVGTADRAVIGADVALKLARAVLDAMRDEPGRPILVIVDNAGHRLSRRDELMANNGCIAHLTRCLDAARRRGHRVIGLVHDLAVSGGFMATGLSTDLCFALPGSEVRVMAPAAMARVTKIPLERLEELSAANPVLGPGVENFIRVGGLEGVWDGDLKARFREALSRPLDGADMRRSLGESRGGRTVAARIAAKVRAGASS
ncbi:biotin-independent malonate decarboxylase subunit gamma [Chenggangzhangella methanolivorans]|uniref:Biotin-independent malonate decarboxylase subunit gamma n=1 Tax=Chenggangzhangella methanolivorans TaxID=1437009 RepID=A0A9E6RBG3_9HYPH|nr:biotin-independent malonate decarboxylase subunit gamma [Chenggangzhangella methanolivorans]QZO01152.1 biotin-independent malonate decarboxylase subunit gamma [Chenggangzhangella methanolivorans]